MFANTILIKYFFYLCNIFKIGQIGAILSNIALLQCKLNSYCRIIPDINYNFFLTKIVSLVHTLPLM